jgi:hypothetical protein
MVEKKRKSFVKRMVTALILGVILAIPRIATVITADLPVISQCRSGDAIRFQSVPVSQAHQLWREMQERLNDLDRRLNAPAAQPQAQPQAGRPGPVRRYRITVNGKVYETSIQMVSQ